MAVAPIQSATVENALNREAACLETEIEPVAAEDAPLYNLPKIMRYTTQSDIKSIRVRQTMANQPLLRTYEVAGTSHADYWDSVVGRAVADYQFGISGDLSTPCDLPMNPLRTGIPLSAIQHRLARWIQYDEMPPPSNFIEREGDFDDKDPITFQPNVHWVTDDGDNDASDGDNGFGDRNVVGGVRPPRTSVPLGIYLGGNPYTVDEDDPDFSVSAAVFCRGIIGGFDAYSPEELEARYTNHSTFVDLTWWNMWMSFEDGFLLPVNALTIINEAIEFDGLPD